MSLSVRWPRRAARTFGGASGSGSQSHWAETVAVEEMAPFSERPQHSLDALSCPGLSVYIQCGG